MIHRTAKETLLRLASQFPVIGVTGPRQSGKSTLTKAALPGKRYVTFDDRTMSELAISNIKNSFKVHAAHFSIIQLCIVYCARKQI